MLIVIPERKCLFSNNQLLQSHEIVDNHIKHDGNKYQSCIVAGIKNLLQENNKSLTLSAPANQIESHWLLPLFTYYTKHA